MGNTDSSPAPKANSRIRNNVDAQQELIRQQTLILQQQVRQRQQLQQQEQIRQQQQLQQEELVRKQQQQQLQQQEQQRQNISRVQDQKSTGTQSPSQANLNAQRIQTSHDSSYSAQSTITDIPCRIDSLEVGLRRQVSAPPIPPLPNILKPTPNSSTHVQLPEPLIPVKNLEFPDLFSKLQLTKPKSFKKVNLNTVYDFEMIKLSLRDVKDPKFLQFHKELNKTKPLSDIRLSLINNQHLSDVEIFVGVKAERIYGHKMFLITASTLFLTHFESNKFFSLYLPEIETPIFLEVLKYCYTNQVKITDENVLELLNAANHLKVRQLSNVCHLFITNLFNEDSIFVIFEKALEQKNEIFEKKCIAYMLNNEEKCFSSKGFYKIGFSSMLDIVGKCKFSNEKNEEIIKKWNYGEGNMVFAASEEKSMLQKRDPSTSQSSGKSKNNNPVLESLLNVASNDYQNNDFVYRDDDNESVLSKDDDREVRTRVSFNGNRKQGVSEFSRLDLSCKKSILLHEIGFTTDLSKHGEEIKLSISIFEGNRRSDIHSRTIKNDRPGMKINYIKFTRTPLKFYIGQKFFIKVNFVGPVSILHVAGDKFSHSDIFETRKDVQKNYLNCVSYLIISDMPRK